MIKNLVIFILGVIIAVLSWKNFINESDPVGDSVSASGGELSKRISGENLPVTPSNDDGQLDYQANDISFEKEAYKETDLKPSDEQVSSSGMPRVPKFRDYATIFEKQPVDAEWSSNQIEKIRQLFDGDQAYKHGILLSDIDCKSNLCKLQLTNFSSDHSELKVSEIMDLIYDQDWSYTFHAQTEPDPEQPGGKIVYLVNDL